MLKHIVIVNGYVLLMVFALVSADGNFGEEWTVTIPLTDQWMGWLIVSVIVFDAGMWVKNEIKRVRGWFRRKKEPETNWS